MCVCVCVCVIVCVCISNWPSIPLNQFLELISKNALIYSIKDKPVDITAASVFIYLFIYLFIFVDLFIHLFIYLFIFVYLFKVKLIETKCSKAEKP